MERRVAELKASVTVFRERLEAGEPFPGDAPADDSNDAGRRCSKRFRSSHD